MAETQTTYTVYDADGKGRSGDAEIVQAMRDKADALGGWIENDQTGEVVYGTKP